MQVLVFPPRNWECFVYLCTPFCSEYLLFLYILVKYAWQIIYSSSRSYGFLCFFAISKMAEVGEKIQNLQK